MLAVQRCGGLNHYTIFRHTIILTFKSHNFADSTSPVSSDIFHKHDAGVHVEVEGWGPKGAVELVDAVQVAGIVGDAERETQAEEEVWGCQVLQVNRHTAGGVLLSLAEVDPQCETVEDQAHLEWALY